jgi:HNH endonuclease
MNRPICPACNQRLCAINYILNDVKHYRSRCEYCIKRSRRLKPPEPRWKSSGYKKKATCDRCGFRAKFSAQLQVFHIDGNLNNSNLRNLKTICQNCVVEIKKSDQVWVPGDLEPDL